MTIFISLHVSIIFKIFNYQNYIFNACDLKPVLKLKYININIIKLN